MEEKKSGTEVVGHGQCNRECVIMAGCALCTPDAIPTECFVCEKMSTAGKWIPEGEFVCTECSERTRRELGLATAEAKVTSCQGAALEAQVAWAGLLEAMEALGASVVPSALARAASLAAVQSRRLAEALEAAPLDSLATLSSGLPRVELRGSVRRDPSSKR